MTTDAETADKVAAIQARWRGELVCPTHGIPDCSPLLNGCTVPAYLRRAADDVQYLIEENTDLRAKVKELEESCRTWHDVYKVANAQRKDRAEAIARAEAAEAELRARELHHFETEQENARLQRALDTVTRIKDRLLDESHAEHPEVPHP